MSGLLALVDGGRGILVDVSLCVTPSSTWVQEQLCQLIVLGYLEINEVSVLIAKSFSSSLFFIYAFVFMRIGFLAGTFTMIQTELSIPFAPERKQVVDPRIILHAVLVTPDDTLDMTEYRAFLEKEL